LTLKFLASAPLEVSRILGVAERLPLKAEVVDAVLLYDALHHFSNPIEGLSEATRALKGDGRIYIFDFNASKIPVKALRIIKLVGFPALLCC